MKGIIFNQLENYVLTNFDEATYERILEKCKLETKVPFVGPGTYSDNDLMLIVKSASETLNIPTEELIVSFGHFLFPKLASRFSNFVDKEKSAKDFLLTVESIIHVEVHKIYDKAYTPTFEYLNNADNKLTIRYRSKRKLYKLMEGIIMGVADYFNCKIDQNIVVHSINDEEVGDFHLTFH